MIASSFVSKYKGLPCAQFSTCVNPPLKAEGFFFYREEEARTLEADGMYMLRQQLVTSCQLPTSFTMSKNEDAAKGATQL